MNEFMYRKNIRLANYNYSKPGYYYLTICTKNKQKLLWRKPVGARIARPALSAIGETVRNGIENISKIYETIIIDKYVIMPNHIHMILIIANEFGRAMRAPTISTIINQMKGYVTKQLGYSIWQKLYYDHIIRDKIDYKDIWQYIEDNPIKWDEDYYYS